ncbi:MAG TPA: hypothetical protein VIS95_04250 [Solirubrobacterales bacterium]
MLSPLRNRFGIPGVIAVIALVFAMIGGAYAASGGLTGQQKKEVKKIAKQEAQKLVKAGPAGPAGPAGSAGPAGTAGAQGPTGPEGLKGPTGPTGTNGTNGADGKTVLSGTTVPGAGLGTNGDFYIRTSTSEIYGPKAAGAWGSPTALKGANGAAGATGPTGPEGSPWVAGTAPSEVLLQGTWAVQQYTAAGAGEAIHVPISTSVPVPTGPTLWVALGAGLVNTEEAQQIAEVFCPGSAANPTINTEIAAQFEFGIVCIYAQEQTNLTPPAGGGNETDFPLGSSGGGLVAKFTSSAAGTAKGFGSWALFTP